MRKLLVLLMLSLLIGAALVWVLQFGNGYILLGFETFSIEMSAWTADLSHRYWTAAVVYSHLALDSWGRRISTLVEQSPQCSKN